MIGYLEGRKTARCSKCNNIMSIRAFKKHKCRNDKK